MLHLPVSIESASLDATESLLLRLSKVTLLWLLQLLICDAGMSAATSESSLLSGASATSELLVLFSTELVKRLDRVDAALLLLHRPCKRRYLLRPLARLNHYRKCLNYCQIRPP